jgi:hypothetical protein
LPTASGIAGWMSRTARRAVSCLLPVGNVPAVSVPAAPHTARRSLAVDLLVSVNRLTRPPSCCDGRAEQNVPPRGGHLDLRVATRGEHDA